MKSVEWSNVLSRADLSGMETLHAHFVRHRYARHGPLRVKLVRGMVVQILESRISNASYWMKIRADREAAYHPVIDVRIETDPLMIRFSDNGLGIARIIASGYFAPTGPCRRAAAPSSGDKSHRHRGRCAACGSGVTTRLTFPGLNRSTGESISL
jgi:hypothetical protein